MQLIPSSDERSKVGVNHTPAGVESPQLHAAVFAKHVEETHSSQRYKNNTSTSPSVLERGGRTSAHQQTGTLILEAFWVVLWIFLPFENFHQNCKHGVPWWQMLSNFRPSQTENWTRRRMLDALGYLEEFNISYPVYLSWVCKHETALMAEELVICAWCWQVLRSKIPVWGGYWPVWGSGRHPVTLNMLNISEWLVLIVQLMLLFAATCFKKMIKVRQILKLLNWKVSLDVMRCSFWAETLCCRAPKYVSVAIVFVFIKISGPHQRCRVRVHVWQQPHWLFFSLDTLRTAH